MGGKKSWQAEEWQDQDWSSYSTSRPPWKVWHGAYASASPKGRPHYDQMPLPADGGAWKGKGKSKNAWVDPEGGSDDMRDVQRALTNARKADGRVRRLREESQRKQEQWKRYEKEHKEEYVKERGRYEAALQRIEADIAEATRQGHTAAQDVRDIVNGRKVTRAPAVTEAENAWDSLIGAGTEVQPEGFLGDALNAADSVHAQPSGNQDGLGRLMTPEVAARLLHATIASLPPGLDVQGVLSGQARPTTTVTDPGPPTVNKEPPPTPFPTSPTSTRPELGIPMVNPAPAASPGNKAKGQKQPIKGGILQPVHTGTGCAGLADKLEAKRQALQPFGLDPSLRATEPHSMAAGQQNISESDEDLHMDHKPDGETNSKLDGMG
ncbi:unnamed protein product [Symbiodinium sp. CCMP2592]|nr:unnamed protein product [Symbiodinium sp. CCMP2592]